MREKNTILISFEIKAPQKHSMKRIQTKNLEIQLLVPALLVATYTSLERILNFSD